MNLRERKSPEQERSKDRVERVLRAAEEVLARDGYSGTTMRAIAIEAQITQPSLYRYWENKQGIVCALADKFVEQQKAVLTQAKMELIGGKNWPDAFRFIVSDLSSASVGHPWVSTCLFALKTDPKLYEKDQEINGYFASEFENLLATAKFQGRKKARERTAKMLVVLMDMLLVESVDQSRSNRTSFETEFLCVLERYLTPVLP